MKKANDAVCVLVQVETGEALNRLEEIAGVEGVDGVFIGPAGLSASLGHLGNPSHPQVQEGIRTAAARLASLGKPSGILASGQADAARYVEWGYRFVAVGSDLGIITRGADALARSMSGLTHIRNSGRS